MILLPKKINIWRTRGFVLPLTLIVSVIILTIATGISVILAKELYFSKLSRLSQIAYYAADNGVMCATMIDDQYIDPETGVGIFPFNNATDDTNEMEAILDKVDQDRQIRGMSQVGSINNIKCATASIFNPAVSGFSVSSFTYNAEVGRTSTFSMRMNLGDGTYRCATVVVNKTPSYRQIISRGFASCGTVFSYPIERAVVSTAESTDTSPTAGSQVFVLTSGTSWTVPAGVTSIKVWAVGAGGGGGGSNGNDSRAGGGGGGGGVAYRQFTVSSGQAISYVVGSPGTGGSNSNDGNKGGNTTVTVSGTTIRGEGGDKGRFNDNSNSNGGTASGGTTNVTGGRGSGASGDVGGGGGGGIGGGDGTLNGCSGGTGGQAQDVAGLFAALAVVSLPTTGPGTGAGCGVDPAVNNVNGNAATGFGSGGGGAGYHGGNGGDGLYGGGGAGAAGYSENNMTGGNGGSGAVVIQAQ